MGGLSLERNSARGGRTAEGKRAVTLHRQHGLDGLRGLAALCVVFSHVVAMRWVPFIDARPGTRLEIFVWNLGAPAVDLFFVLSGLVIGQSLQAHPTSYARFVSSRYVRIIPMAWIGMLFGFGVRALAAGLPPGMSSAMRNLVQPIPLPGLIGLITQTWPIPVADGIDPPLWSLFIEVQAGWFMPLVARLVPKWPALAFLATLVIAAAMTVATRTYYPPMFVAFGIGMTLPEIERRWTWLPGRWVLLFGGALILFSRHIVSRPDDDQWWMRIVCAFGAAGVIMAVRRGALATFLDSTPVQFLGRISYPFYTIHFPVMIAAVWVAGRLSGITPSAILSIPVAILVAWIATIAIDIPAMRLSRIVKGWPSRATES